MPSLCGQLGTSDLSLVHESQHQFRNVCKKVAYPGDQEGRRCCVARGDRNLEEEDLVQLPADGSLMHSAIGEAKIVFWWRHLVENQRIPRCSKTLLVEQIRLGNCFRLWRRRREYYLAELASKSRFVERCRRQYLTRHAVDLWYIDTVRAVSRRAMDTLDFVREWQRCDWEQWVACFRFRTLAGTVLRFWYILMVAGMPARDANSSLEPSSVVMFAISLAQQYIRSSVFAGTLVQ